MKKVLLLMCQGVEIYEAAAFYDVLGWSESESGRHVEVVTVGLEEQVRGTFGIRIVPDMMLSTARTEDFDALAIPGGFEEYGFYEHAYSEAVVDLIRDFNKLNKPIASICVGALPVANSGILKGRNATTYHLGGGARRKQLSDFGVNVIDKPIVCDRNVITSTGPGTAIDVAFWLLAQLAGQENADHVRHLMGFTESIDV